MQNKAVAEQGLEEGEEEENRGKEEVEDMGLGWMEACCMALDLHAAEPAVQVSPASAGPQIQQILCVESFESYYSAALGSCKLGHSQSITTRSRSEQFRGGAG